MEESLELMSKNNESNISKIDANRSMEEVREKFIEVIESVLDRNS